MSEPETYRIRPLMWAIDAENFCCERYLAPVPGGVYKIERTRDSRRWPWGPWAMRYYFDQGLRGRLESPSLAKAKAAANSHWKEQIKPALVRVRASNPPAGS